MLKWRKIHKFRKAIRGNVALAFAITLPVTLGVMGSGFDYLELSKNHKKLQSIADSAAIAAAREVSLANTNAGQIAEVARVSAVNTSKMSNNKLGVGDLKVTVSDNRASIEVKMTVTWQPKFSQIIGRAASKIEVLAIANVIGSGNICVMSLNPTRALSILIDNNAQLLGVDCGIFSKSTSQRSLVVRQNAKLEAGFICSSGGAKKRIGARIIPTAITDCPSPDDPLAGRIKPIVGACDHTDLVLRNFTGVLSPGVYCGGLKLLRGSAPRFEAGVYIMKDGPLIVGKSSQLKATGVGFYLTGTDASFKFYRNSIVSLVAPKKGVLAGILFFQDPNIPLVSQAGYEPTKNVIRSKRADVLEGTIYLPRGRLVIDGDGTVAGDSAYTAIIVDQMRLQEGPTLTLNSDYKSTDVPVPEGIAGGKVVLAN